MKDLCAEVGSGGLTARIVLESVFPSIKKRPKRNIKTDKTVKPLRKTKINGVPITGLTPGMAIHIAECCHPLPGDRIVGIQRSGKGVNIHTIDCEILADFQEKTQKWLDVAWGNEENQSVHVGRIVLSVENTPGALGELSTAIARSNGNISNLKITRREHDFFNMFIDVEVKNVEHLTNIIAALRADPSINSVDRSRG